LNRKTDAKPTSEISNPGPNRPQRWTVLGLGSPHGDDRLGWLVIEELRKLLESADVQCAALAGSEILTCRAIATPHEILDELEQTTYLLLCDAACGSDFGAFRHHLWPALPESPRPRQSTHAAGLQPSLQLAAELFPHVQDIHICTINGSQWEPLSQANPQLVARLNEWAQQIMQTCWPTFHNAGITPSKR